MEDDRVAILEAQLAQAKLIAEEADKKYEEVDTQFTSQSILLVRIRCAANGHTFVVASGVVGTLGTRASFIPLPTGLSGVAGVAVRISLD